MIVTYNSNHVLKDCLAALGAAINYMNRLVDFDTKVVIIDNGSSANLAVPEIADRCSVDTVKLSRNQGFAPAVNMALPKVANTEWILLLNPDARVDESAIWKLIDAARKRNAVLAGPLLLGPDGSPQLSERPFHTIRRELRRQLLPFHQSKPYGRAARLNGEARCLSGACLLIDSKFLQRAGGLDEQIRMYLEDVELCSLAHALGHNVLFVETARCIHEPGGSSEGVNFTKTQHLHETLLAARVEFVRRRQGSIGAATMRFLIAVGSLVRLLACSASRERCKKYGRSLRWALFSGQAPPWPDGP